jgi:hypothetical protein
MAALRGSVLFRHVKLPFFSQPQTPKTTSYCVVACRSATHGQAAWWLSWICCKWHFWLEWMNDYIFESFRTVLWAYMAQIFYEIVILVFFCFSHVLVTFIVGFFWWKMIHTQHEAQCRWEDALCAVDGCIIRFHFWVFTKGCWALMRFFKNISFHKSKRWVIHYSWWEQTGEQGGTPAGKRMYLLDMFVCLFVQMLFLQGRFCEGFVSLFPWFRC